MQDPRNGYIWYPTFKRAGSPDADGLFGTLYGMLWVQGLGFKV